MDAGGVDWRQELVAYINFTRRDDQTDGEEYALNVERARRLGYVGRSGAVSVGLSDVDRVADGMRVYVLPGLAAAHSMAESSEDGYVTVSRELLGQWLDVARQAVAVLGQLDTSM